jgi:hypothetical protein
VGGSPKSTDQFCNIGQTKSSITLDRQYSQVRQHRGKKNRQAGKNGQIVMERLWAGRSRERIKRERISRERSQEPRSGPRDRSTEPIQAGAKPKQMAHITSAIAAIIIEKVMKFPFRSGFRLQRACAPVGVINLSLT